MADNKVYSIYDVENMHIPAEFGVDDDGCDTDCIDFVIDQIDDSEVEYAYGATKFVLLFDKEVVKIPFNGFYSWDDENGIEVFDEFQYISNYCETEASIYADAVAAGLEMFLASTKYAGRTSDGTPYYISERVEPFNSDSSSIVKASEDSRNKAKNYWFANGEWVAQAIECYGEEKVKAFEEFAEDHSINDLHYGNVGYRQNGEPVILDYSGFHE